MYFTTHRRIGSIRRACISLVLTAGIFTLSCARRDTVSSFDTVCSGAAGSDVTVSGYLRLPGAGASRGMDKAASSQEMILTENREWRGGFLRIVMPVAKSAGPNRMEMLPAAHTYADLHVFDERGRPVNTGERLQITGEIVKGADGCTLHVSRVASP